MKTNHPWQVGPSELIEFALERMHKGSDFDRRLAFLILDVGVETLFKTYLTLPEGVTQFQTKRGERLAASEGNFHELIHGVKNASPKKASGQNFPYIEYFHNIRNTLYHQGNQVTAVPIYQVEGYAKLAVDLLREYLDVDLSNKLTPPEPIKSDETDPVVDSVDVDVSFGRHRIERLKSQSIRVFSVTTNAYQTPVKPFLRAVVDELSLPVEFTMKNGVEKNTRSLGKDIIDKIKQIKIRNRIPKDRKKTRTKQAYTYDVSVYGVQKRYLIKENVMFHVIKNLCSNNITPAKIEELISWRSESLFFALEGEFTSAEFIEHANGKLGRNRKKFDQSRWFCDDGQLLLQNGKTYAFTNSWGKRWVTALKTLQQAFPEAEITFSKNQ